MSAELKIIRQKEKKFPVSVENREDFLRFVAEYIRFPLENGACQITIHADGNGNIRQTNEMRVNK